MRRGLLLGLGVVGASLALASGLIGADDKPIQSRDTSSESASQTLRKQRQALADEIARISTSRKSDSAKGDDNDDTLTLLRSLDALYAQHYAVLEQRRRLDEQLTDAEQELSSLDHFAPNEPKPYSFLFLDSLKDQLEVEEELEIAIAADLKSAQRLLKAAHDELDASAHDRRKSRAPDAGKSSPDDSKVPQFGFRRPDTLARAKVGLEQAEVEVHTLRSTLCKTVEKQLAKKIATVSKDVAFSERDRDQQLERLAGAEADLTRQRKETLTHLQEFASRRADALKELSDQKAPQTIVGAAVDAWRVAEDVYQAEVVLLDQQLDILADVRRHWKRRYELASTTPEPERVSRWLDDLDEFLDQLKTLAGSLEHKLAALRNKPSESTREAQAVPGDALAKWMSFRDARVGDLRDLSDARLTDIKSMQRMLGRFRTELKSKSKASPDNWTARIGNSVTTFLGYKVAEDEERSVTVGKLLLLLAYIVAGIVLASFLSRLIGRRVLRHVGVHRGTADGLRSILFYALCVFFGVVAFQMLNIPLAAFAFLGGAAALAIGFGGQDIMNNFMSGVILLTEQPIRVGDIIQLKDVQGVVVYIGLRSTRLQTAANHELSVPNKTLLEERVTNLTLSDNFVEMCVTATLDRSVSVQPAKRKMLEVAFAHPLVMKSPRPVVLLKECDIYWSTFEVHFWLQYANVMKCAIVQSQILEAISECFPQVDSTDSISPSLPGRTPGDDSSLATTAKNGVAPSNLKMMSKAVMATQMKRVRDAVRLKG